MLKYKATTRVLKTFTTWAKDWGFALASEVLVGVSGFSSSLGIKADQSHLEGIEDNWGFRKTLVPYSRSL